LNPSRASTFWSVTTAGPLSPLLSLPPAGTVTLSGIVGRATGFLCPGLAGVRARCVAVVAGAVGSGVVACGAVVPAAGWRFEPVQVALPGQPVVGAACALVGRVPVAQLVLHRHPSLRRETLVPLLSMLRTPSAAAAIVLHKQGFYDRSPSPARNASISAASSRGRSSGISWPQSTSASRAPSIRSTIPARR